MDAARGFVVNAKTDVADVQAHQCFICMWAGTCTFVKRYAFLLFLFNPSTHTHTCISTYKQIHPPQ